MAEFVASLVTLSEVGFRIGGAFLDLIKTMKNAEEDITLMLLTVQSNAALTQNLGEKIERYSRSRTVHVQSIHSVLRGLIAYCNSIYSKIETVLGRFNTSTNAFASSSTNISSASATMDLRLKVAWTQKRPQLDRELSKLAQINDQLTMHMTLLEMEFSDYFQSEASPLLYVKLQMPLEMAEANE